KTLVMEDQAIQNPFLLFFLSFSLFSLFFPLFSSSPLFPFSVSLLGWRSAHAGRRTRWRRGETTLINGVWRRVLVLRRGGQRPTAAPHARAHTHTHTHTHTHSPTNTPNSDTSTTSIANQTHTHTQ